MIEKWIQSYNPKSHDEIKNAKREIFQEIALSGLRRSGFFNKACFYGGTALRIFYGLDRYSEDLDFSLLEKNMGFTLEPYLPFIEEEFRTIGLDAEVSIKKKKIESPVQSAFLKDTTEWSLLQIDVDSGLNYQSKIKVKIEVDRGPPLLFRTESKLMSRPYTQYINCMIQEDLFAGKMHAVMFRQWTNNEKGRDWYDLVWYISNKIPLGLSHFNERAKDSGSLVGEAPFTNRTLLESLHNRIDQIKMDMALIDINRFIYDKQKLEIWSKKFFHDVIEQIIVQ